jgi:hypothetical protein
MNDLPTYIVANRIIDITVHAIIFLLCVSLLSHFPRRQLFRRLVTTGIGFCSLFVSITCWKYGRTPTFLALHNLWELMVLAELATAYVRHKNK